MFFLRLFSISKVWSMFFPQQRTLIMRRCQQIDKWFSTGVLRHSSVPLKLFGCPAKYFQVWKRMENCTFLSFLLYFWPLGVPQNIFTQVSVPQPQKGWESLKWIHRFVKWLAHWSLLLKTDCKFNQTNCFGAI